MDKKLIPVIIVNLIIILGFYFVLTYLITKHPNYELKINLFQPNYQNIPIDITKYELMDKLDDFITLELNQKSINKFCGEKRFAFGEQYTNNPIVILGCSYPYGHGLKKEQSFPYILSDITQRPIYSFASCANDAITGIDNIISYSNNNDAFANKIEKADYYIYIYMWDHINRYLYTSFMLKNYAKYGKVTFIDKLMGFSLITKFIDIKFKRKYILNKYPESDRSCLYLKELLLSLYDKIITLSPKAKLIIILYNEKMTYTWGRYKIKYVNDIINSDFWQELERETDGGIQVIRTKDLTGFSFGKEWKLTSDITDWHPNEKVWAYLTPLFAEKYIK